MNRINLVVVIVFVFSGFSCDKSRRVDYVHSLDGNSKPPPKRKSTQLEARGISMAQVAYRLTGEWDGLSKELSGEELLAKQREMALRAVGELGAGPELLEFLDYLTQRGPGDVR